MKLIGRAFQAEMRAVEDQRAFVKWDQSSSVKSARCDEDHKKLFALIDSLHDAMLAGKGEEKIRQVVR